MVTVTMVALGCDGAEVVTCGTGGIHEVLRGVEYCVYPGAGPGLRCPEGTTLRGEFSGGIVCASRPATDDAAIADDVCRHLEGGCSDPVSPPDAGPDSTSAEGGADAGTPVPCVGAECTAVVEIAAGLRVTCARLGSGAVHCWGDNANGMIGDGTFEGRLAPVVVEGLGDVVQLNAGALHTCALRRDGVVLCWGHNRFGALGDGAAADVDSPSPVRVELSERARAVAAGEFHTCALGMSGRVYCWGFNESLQLGDGSRGSMDARPAVVPGVEGAGQIDTTYAHTCALREEATGERVVTCWGRNEEAQLGTGDATPDGQPPSEAMRGRDLERVAVGARHTCVLHADGGVDCWGAGSTGETGDPELVHPRTTPSRVPELVADHLDAGSAFTCALVADGTARCWGANAVDASQLGAGSGVGFSAIPLRVRDVVGATLLAVGWHHACAVEDGHDVRCWGKNEDGQLGNGAMHPSEGAPVTVLGLSP